MRKNRHVCCRYVLLCLPLWFFGCTDAGVPEERAAYDVSPGAAVGDQSSRSSGPSQPLQPDRTLGRGRSLGFSATPLGEKLQTYHELLDADEFPGVALAELQREAGAAAREVAGAYRSLDRSRGSDRWNLVHTLGALRTPEAVADLAAIAFEPVPTRARPAPASQTDSYSTKGCHANEDFESMIRARAVEGLASLARHGDMTAERELLALTAAPALSARRAAVQAYLRLPGDRAARRTELEKRLPPDERWMLDVRPGRAEDFMGEPVSSKTPKPNLPPAPANP